MRQGPELVRASNPFAKEDRATTWRLLASTIALFLAIQAASIAAPMFLAHAWVVQLPLAVLAALVSVRMFIFYHDYLHGAILTGSRVGGWVMNAIGFWTLAGPSVWKQTHDYHHKHTAKMVGASIGSYPVVSVEMWQLMNPAQRRAYLAIRHPLNMIFGYFTVFMIGMCLSPFKRSRAHYDGPLALALHFALIGLVGTLASWTTALFVVVLPVAIACAMGSYLFYAQHNFPGMAIRGRQDWEYSFAALHSSSMMDMPPILHWFTGNIGYHHVHHLNHRIPFYRLPEAMAALPELQSPARTSLRPADVLACLRLAMWDPAQGRMLQWSELSR